MLALDKVSKFYGGRTIFDSVSWAMADDARVGLVGLNGAGKTTLLRMIGERDHARRGPHRAPAAHFRSAICRKIRPRWAAGRCSTKRSRH